MPPEPEPQENRKDQSEPARRAFSRRLQRNMKCNLGPVLDLSAGGMRVISKKALNGMVEVRLETPGIEQVLTARVVWVKKVRFRMYEIGLEFLGRQSARHLVEWISVWSGSPHAA